MNTWRQGLKTKAAIEDLFAHNCAYLFKKSRDFPFGHPTHPEIRRRGNVFPPNLRVVQEINVPGDIACAKDRFPQFAGESFFIPEVMNPVVCKFDCAFFRSLAVVTAKYRLPNGIHSGIVIGGIVKNSLDFGDPPTA